MKVKISLKGVFYEKTSFNDNGDDDGVSYTFNNAYSYGRTLCYGSVTVTA